MEESSYYQVSVNFFFRRVKFITHRKVQIGLASIFMLWLFVFLAVFGFIFFVNFKGASERTSEMQIHDQLLAKLLLVQQTKDLALWYGLAAVGYVTMIWFYVLAYSHRLTGPIYKITKALHSSVEKGELPKKITFRKGDAFPELADAFNKFLEHVDFSKKH